MRHVRTLLLAVMLLGGSADAAATRQIDYCAGATAAGPQARSEGERVDALRAAVVDASQKLEQAFWLFEHAHSAVGSSARPVPLGEPGEGRGLEQALFSLTVSHWLDVKSALCRCLPEDEREKTACARLAEETQRACNLAPHTPGIDTRCLTKP